MAKELAGTSGWKAAYAALYHDGAVAYPPACLHYVLEVVRSASRNRGNALTPADTTEAFREAVRCDFGPLSDAVFADWELRTPKDLGLAVDLLGRSGCLTLDSEDVPENFALDGVSFLENEP